MCCKRLGFLLAGVLAATLWIAACKPSATEGPAVSGAGGHGPGGAAGKPIVIKGSDTMVLLGQRWAEEYMKKHPEVTLQVTGGGSGTGIAALINGSTDIAEASRPMKPEEKEQAEAKRGQPVKEIQTALDGLAIYVNEANPVSELSFAQLKAIYTGQATNWSAVGGRNGPIVLYGRENNSGTYMFFREHVLDDEDYSPRMQSLAGTAAVINAVAKDVNGIGYGGIGYAKRIKVVKVKKDESSPAVEPTMDTIVSNEYPISRYLYWYVIGEPQGQAADLINWVLGPEGQAVVEKVGYYPLPKK